jgi:hypothetical protein
MNKNQKLILGVGVVAVAAYFYFQSKKAKAPFVKANLAGNKKGFLAGKVMPMGSDGAFKKAGFLAGDVKPVGSTHAGVFATFANQETSGDAKFAKMAGFAKVNSSGDMTPRNIPTEMVSTIPTLNPFFKVQGAHVGTPNLWAKNM